MYNLRPARPVSTSRRPAERLFFRSGFMTAKFVATLSLVVVLGWSGSAARRRFKGSRPGQVGHLHGLPRHGRQQRQPGVAEPRGPARLLHRQAAQALQGRRAPERADVADGDDPLRPGHRGPRGVFLLAEAAPAAKPTRPSSKLGERIYRGGVAGNGAPACAGCHGPNGCGNPAAALPAHRRPARDLRRRSSCGPTRPARAQPTRTR